MGEKVYLFYPWVWFYLVSIYKGWLIFTIDKIGQTNFIRYLVIKSHGRVHIHCTCTWLPPCTWKPKGTRSLDVYQNVAIKLGLKSCIFDTPFGSWETPKVCMTVMHIWFLEPLILRFMIHGSCSILPDKYGDVFCNQMSGQEQNFGNPLYVPLYVPYFERSTHLWLSFMQYQYQG